MNLQEYIDKYPEAKLRFEYNINIKSKVRHKIINDKRDFDVATKKILSALKKEVFENNDIFVFGSRINGTYITDKEYIKYSKIYQNVKKSDWDIQSIFKPDADKLKAFQDKYNIKIDFQIGTKKIKF
jgi:hypothetical protein